MRRMKDARIIVLCWLLALLSCYMKPCFADISELPIQITPGAPYKTKIERIKNSFAINLNTKIPENTEVNPQFSLSFFSTRKWVSPLIIITAYDDDCTGEYEFKVSYRGGRSTLVTHYFNTTVKWGEAVNITLSKLARDKYTLFVNGEKTSIDVIKKLKQLDLESRMPLELISIGNDN